MSKRIALRVPDSNPPHQDVKKDYGTLEFALQEDGTWKAFIGERTLCPILEVVGPDPESIALFAQDLRDKLGHRDTHNIRLHHCVWVNDQCLRISISATPTNHTVERDELMDVLLHAHKHNTRIPNWEMQSQVMRIFTQEAKTEDDRDTLRDLCALLNEESGNS